eukprot:864581-Rhodomonas_salina.1
MCCDVLRRWGPGGVDLGDALDMRNASAPRCGADKVCECSRRGECAEGLAFYEGALKKGVGLSAAQRHKLTGIIAVTQKQVSTAICFETFRSIPSNMRDVHVERGCQVRGDISGAVVGVTDDGEVVTVQGVPGVDFVHTMNAGGA